MSDQVVTWPSHPALDPIGKGQRVLHVATRFRLGGAERNIAHQISWERASGFDVELAVGPNSIADVAPAGIKVHSLKWLKRNVQPVHDVLSLVELRRLIRRGRYDIVHTHLSKAGIVGRIAARGVAPLVIHTVHMSSFGPGYRPHASVVYRLAEARCAAYADVIVFVGEGLLQQYARHRVGSPAQRMVIPSPIDLAPMLESRSWTEAVRTEARRRCGVDTDASFIVSVGALEPRKRHYLILEELADALRTTDAVLAIAGQGPELERLRRAAVILGIENRVRFLGHLPDITELLAAADLLVHASTAEGVPQVVIQALAAGTPVVATDVAGLREISEAPIVTVPADGRSLGSHAANVLQRPPPAVDSSAFEQWSCPAVDRRLGELYRRLGMTA